MSAPIRALVTNDDGIGSPGLHRLAQVAVDAGWEAVIAAPREDSSGASASITSMREGDRVLTERRPIKGLAGIEAYAVDATPSYIVLLALRGAFGDPPDVVLSGINNGHNVGRAVLHSGTVGAVLTAASQGLRGMAVSAAAAHEPHWDTASAAAAELLDWLATAPKGSALNVNAPDAPAEKVRGHRLATLARFGAVQMTVAERGEQYVRVEVVDVEADLETGTDAALLADGWVTLTPLLGPCEADADGLGLQAYAPH